MKCGFSLQMLPINFVAYSAAESAWVLRPSLASSAMAGSSLAKRSESAMSRAMAATSLLCRVCEFLVLRSRLKVVRYSCLCSAEAANLSSTSLVASDSSCSNFLSRLLMNGFSLCYYYIII